MKGLGSLKLLATDEHKILLLYYLLFAIPAQAQERNPPPCFDVKQVEIASTPLENRLLDEFIQKSIRDGGFQARYDKGIVHLHAYRNEQGKRCWLLIPYIDDRYKDNPPTRFSDFRGDIILIYDANSTGLALKTEGNIEARNQCLEQIIGDRVFSRQPRRYRWTSTMVPFANKKRIEGTRRITGGNGGDVIIIFNEDGTYELLYPL
jgi:hypothetical protein